MIRLRFSLPSFVKRFLHRGQVFVVVLHLCIFASKTSIEDRIIGLSLRVYWRFCLHIVAADDRLLQYGDRVSNTISNIVTLGFEVRPLYSKFRHYNNIEYSQIVLISIDRNKLKKICNRSKIHAYSNSVFLVQ
jgi:hypothetical protein